MPGGLLIKVAKEFNVGLHTIVEHLQKKGFAIEEKPTAKVTEEMYGELLKEFQTSILEKSQADAMLQKQVAANAIKEKEKEKTKIEVNLFGSSAKEAPPKKKEEPKEEKPKEVIKASVKEEDKPKLKVVGKIKLKESKTVYLFNGSKKLNQQAQFAVLDISVGNKDLQQCADAVMRLRAEYLFTANKFESISFADNEGGVYLFSQPYSREHLHTYLQKVFGMCGSASLSKQLRPATIETIKPGDVFIRGGFPGHAAIVMDVAANAEGKRIFMLAQSHMPAQDIHVLANPMDKNLSPWYEVNDNNEIVTPEYVFKRNELKSWAE